MPCAVHLSSMYVVCCTLTAPHSSPTALLQWKPPACALLHHTAARLPSSNGIVRRHLCVPLWPLLYDTAVQQPSCQESIWRHLCVPYCTTQHPDWPAAREASGGICDSTFCSSAMTSVISGR